MCIFLVVSDKVHTSTLLLKPYLDLKGSPGETKNLPDATVVTVIFTVTPAIKKLSDSFN